MRTLDGMTCAITGASSGIGRALAVELHDRGARLALAARRVNLLDELNAELGGGHLVVSCDVAVEDDCRRLVAETVGRFGRLDTMVANAGYGSAKRGIDMTRSDWQAMYATNVFGTADCCRFAAQAMREQPEADGYRGQLVLVSSAAARRGLPFFGAYAGTKAAQLSLAEALRTELAADRIAVTTVHPVGTASEFMDVAERTGGQRVNTPGRSPVQQTAETVARKTAGVIARPRRELWPARGSRALLALAAGVPALGDTVMKTALRSIEKHQARE